MIEPNTLRSIGTLLDKKIDDGTIQVSFVKTCSQLADIFTKALGKTKFESCRKHLNLKRLIEIPS